MLLYTQSPAQSLNKAYFKEKVSRSNIEKLKANFISLFGKVQPGISEDTLKDYITEFLRNTWYNPDHAITINKERKDLAIHTGKTAADNVAVIAEIKKEGSAEMITAAKPNVKALHELVLYYLQERITTGNNEVKYLLATDVNNWVLIDANEFDKKIYRNTHILKLYDIYTNDKKDNPFFYDELKKIFSETEETINATFFNLGDYKKVITNADKSDDKKLIALYKILSPVHLIKLSFANDSNSLDKYFYAELLHIIGLEEVKEGSKKLIGRKKISSEASLLENAIIKLQDKDCLRYLTDASRYGLTAGEQLYNIALELCITWINRILFLKLLEAQLYAYHSGANKDCLFLNNTLVPDFDELNNLFLQVLAEKPASRRERLQARFSKVPYLNSSLFERTELERKTIDISALDNGLTLPLYDKTVLKDGAGKKSLVSLSTLNYLFTFLDSYDFTSEGNAEIQEENKTLINASVLGLIFEKINGYKDGSFFTPGFITMYMCRETLRRAVVQKFNEANGSNHQSFEELQSAIDFQDKEKRKQSNIIINSLSICDPAVGSGHFLVSALNELISIKHDLKILQYRHNGQRIKEYRVEIVNDELIVQDIETEDLFEYTLNQKGNIKPELQYMQETLFHEKETLIENCLFGVDINANSVKICRLRLWIELLKNAYYTSATQYTQLETLPNIDINIKQGNSLISRFALDADLSGTLNKSRFTIDSYKAAAQTYRNAQSKEEKREMELLIDTIKKDFRTNVVTYDPINKKLSRLRGELALLERTDLFSADTKKKTKANKELEKLSAAIVKLEAEKIDIQNNAIYKDAFEWRFEFPEVLDGDGTFIGFDVVIGNPPYVFARENFDQSIKTYFSSFYNTSQYQINLFMLFIERANQILTTSGSLTLIIPNSFLMVSSAKNIRKYILDNNQLKEIVSFLGYSFEGINVETIIISCEKKKATENSKINILIGKNNQITYTFSKEQKYFMENEGFELTVFSDEKSDSIIQKLIQDSSLLNSLVIIKAGLQAYESGKGIPKQTPDDVINRPYDYNYKFDNQTYEYLEGKDVGRYYINWSGQFLKYGEHLAAARNFDIFEGKKIIIREISGKHPNSIIATYEEKTYLFNRSNIAIKENETAEIDLKYILALLNSVLLSFYFTKNTAKSVRQMFPKLILEDLRKFPIKKIDSSSQLPFVTLVDKILAAKKKDPRADTSHLEKKIDELVYALYGLTDEEIGIVEKS